MITVSLPWVDTHDYTSFSLQDVGGSYNPSSTHHCTEEEKSDSNDDDDDDDWSDAINNGSGPGSPSSPGDAVVL